MGTLTITINDFTADDYKEMTTLCGVSLDEQIGFIVHDALREELGLEPINNPPPTMSEYRQVMAILRDD